MNAYPERARFILLLVISGACNTPFQSPHNAEIISPLRGKDIWDQFNNRLSVVSEPLHKNVTPVPVDPLRYADPVTTIDHEALLLITIGVLNCIIPDGIPFCHSTV